MPKLKCALCKEEAILTSYFDKKTDIRKTACSKCTELYGLTDDSKYYAVPFIDINEQQKVRPKPN